MLFQVLVVLHTLGATVWTGGHLVLAATVLPQALKQNDPDRIHQFEEHFEGFGLGALLLQVMTGLWLTWIYFPGFQSFLEFNSFLSVYIGIKLLLLLGTVALALHARFFYYSKPDKRDSNFSGLSYCRCHYVSCFICDFGVRYSSRGLRINVRRQHDLTGARLSKTWLRGVDFRKVKLLQTDFRSANLGIADFRGALLDAAEDRDHI